MECLCGHTRASHLDHRGEWTNCYTDACGCVGFSPVFASTLASKADDDEG